MTQEEASSHLSKPLLKNYPGAEVFGDGVILSERTWHKACKARPRRKQSGAHFECCTVLQKLACTRAGQLGHQHLQGCIWQSLHAAGGCVTYPVPSSRSYFFSLSSVDQSGTESETLPDCLREADAGTILVDCQDWLLPAHYAH